MLHTTLLQKNHSSPTIRHRWFRQHFGFLLLLFAAITYVASSQAYAEQLTISGTTTNTTGNPLPSATILYL